MQQPLIMIIPDDNSNSIQYAPKICVDYLSHDWSQEDIWTSWKVMSKTKKELSNGVRLENASWRTWAKQKYNLKTVNPNKLNWLKDSDVTWLYGPLHTAWSKHMDTPKLQKTEDKLNLMPPTTSTKSCLKKKSISEILRPAGRVKYGPLVSSCSDTELYRKESERDSESDSSDCETSSTCSSISGPTTPTSPFKTFFLPVEKNGSQNKKIQFNDCVEQCIVVESDDDDDESSESDDSDSSDDGGIIIKKKKRDSFSTICKLAPTKLKEDRIRNNEFYTNPRRQENSSTTSSSMATATTTSSSLSLPTFDEDDDLDLDFDAIDFEPAISPPTNYQSDFIIQPPETPDENTNEEENNDLFDKIDKAIDIANGIVHWCSGFVYVTLRRRIF